jgi:hypothetical protein
MKNINKFKATAIAVAIAGSMLAAGTAQAAYYGDVNASYDGVSPGNTNGVNGGVFNFTKIAAGTTFTTPLLTNSPAGDFIGFCLDLGQFVDSPVLYKVQDLTDAPVPGTKITAAKATDLAKLVGGVLAGSFNNVATILDSNLKASAFQLAVWEIVNETGGTYDSAAGSFIKGDGTVQTLANTYLSSIVGATAASGLFALTNDGKQDFMVQVVPIPAAAWLLGSGLLGLFGLARRKQVAA